MLPGDTYEQQPLYALTKSRSIYDHKATILKCFEIDRHWLHYYFNLIQFDRPFAWKKNALVWRGTTTGQEDRPASRFACVTRWYEQHPEIDVGFSSVSQGKERFRDYTKDGKSINKLLTYKYILSIEGNDKDSGLNWKLNSNSIVFMAKPTCVSWLMEDQLVPNYHYILVKDDFSDLHDRYKWCEEHPSECLRIVQNANRYMSMFLDIGNELDIERRVLNTYMANINDPGGTFTPRSPPSISSVNWGLHLNPAGWCKSFFNSFELLASLIFR